MSNQTHHDLGRMAASRHGLFTAVDAQAIGISKATITDRVAAGRYRRVAPGVYAVAGAPVSTGQRIAAVVLSFPNLAAASHRTAAALWHLTDRGIQQIDVVTTRWDRVPRAEAVVHESSDLIEADVMELDGIAVTSPQRTVVDLGAVNRWLVEPALEQGIRRRLFTLDDVEQIVKRVARRGRRGVGVIRPLLEKRRRWDTATESALEDRFRALLAGSDVPPPSTQYVVRDTTGVAIARADFAFPGHRVLVELDSEAHHMDRLTFRNDRRKQNGAAVLGWTVLRYTWWDIVEQPWRVRSEVAAALRGATVKAR